MATIDSVITDARYDLRDADSTEFTDAELLAYANRALRQLDNVLSALKSDWVYNEADVTLSTAANSASVPTGTIAVRSAWIDEVQLCKMSPEWIYEQRKYITATGEPIHFAEAGSLMIFEYTANADYTVKTYYDKRATALVDGASMPYSDEFNDPIREMIIILGHKRQESDVFTDTNIYNYFFEKVGGNILRRKHLPKRRRLDF